MNIRSRFSFTMGLGLLFSATVLSVPGSAICPTDWIQCSSSKAVLSATYDLGQAMGLVELHIPDGLLQPDGTLTARAGQTGTLLVEIIEHASGPPQPVTITLGTAAALEWSTGTTRTVTPSGLQKETFAFTVASTAKSGPVEVPVTVQRGEAQAPMTLTFQVDSGVPVNVHTLTANVGPILALGVAAFAVGLAGIVILTPSVFRKNA